MATQHSPKAVTPGRTPVASATKPVAAKASAIEAVILKEIREVKGSLGGMEDRLGDRMVKLEGRMEAGMASTKGAVDSLEKRVIDNKAGLEGNIEHVLDRRITAIEMGLTKSLEEKLALILKTHLGQGPRAGVIAIAREEAYLLCRRSIRMWPLDPRDVQASLRDYLSAKLKFPADPVDSMGPFQITRAKGGLGPVSYTHLTLPTIYSV